LFINSYVSGRKAIIFNMDIVIFFLQYFYILSTINVDLHVESFSISYHAQISKIFDIFAVLHVLDFA